MIDFKPVRLGDRAVIERYTMPSGICNCDLAFANMYCWQAVFHSAWAEIGGFLVIRFQIDGGERIGYMQPVGEGDFGPILPLLREDAHAHGTAAADHRPDGRRPRHDPPDRSLPFRVRVGPRAGRLRLQRRRSSQPCRTPLSAQAQPHQPLHGRISRLPLRRADARPLRGVHGPRARMAQGPRRPHLGAVRRAAGHASGPSSISKNWG